MLPAPPDIPIPPGPDGDTKPAPGGLGPLRQLQVRFDPEQDRLLLRASTQRNAELRCWLTRRMVRLLWPRLMEGLSRRAQAESKAPEEVREQVAAFRREEALQKADFSKPYDEVPEVTLPLGDAPVLVTRISVRPTEKGLVLQLLPSQGQGLTLALDERLLYSICELIRRTAQVAEWDLDLRVPEVSSPASPSAAH